jgi:hypothetical protein
MSGFLDIGVDLGLGEPWEIAAAPICGQTLAVDDKIEVYEGYVRDPSGRATRVVRWTAGRKGDEHVFAYDAQGRLLSDQENELESDGIRRPHTRDDYVRDAAGKLTSIRSTSWYRDYKTDDPTTDTRREQTGESPVTLDAHGRLIRVGGDLGYTEYTLDAKGRRTLERSMEAPFQTLGGTVPAREGLVTTFVYDGATAVETIRERSRELVVTWTFDEAGIPLTARYENELTTWLRDCSGFPAIPE